MCHVKNTPRFVEYFAGGLTVCARVFSALSRHLESGVDPGNEVANLRGNIILARIGHHCRISYRESLGMSPCIMGLTTQDPYIQKEHTKLYKILKFRVNWASIEQETAIQKLQNSLTNVWIAGQIHTFLCKF